MSNTIPQYFIRIFNLIFSARRKNFQLALISGKKFNYFDDLILKIYDYNYLTNNYNIDYLAKNDPEAYFNVKVQQIVDEKKQHDLESKFWSLDTKINDDQATLQIPAYFTYNKPRDNKNLEDSEQSSKPVEKPLIQPFDPRFTLAMYYYYLDQQMTTAHHDSSSSSSENSITVPFNCSQQDKPDCSILDAHEDARKIETEKKKMEKLAKQWDENKRKAEEEKKKAEEDKKKEEEEKKKAEEEEKQRHEQEKQALEEDKKKLEEEKKKIEEEKNKLQEQQQQQQEEKANDGNQSILNFQDKSDSDSDRAKIDMTTFFNEAFEKLSDEDKASVAKDVEDAVKKITQPSSWCVPNAKLSIDHSDKQIVHPGFNVFKSPGRTTPQKAIIAGKSFLYSYAPPPSSILFLTSEGSYSVNVQHSAPLLRNGIPESYLANNNFDVSLNVLQQLHKLKKNHKPDTAKVINDYLLHIPKESFKYDPDSIIFDYTKRLDKGEKLTIKELKYLQSLEYSKDKVAHGGPPKYFAESRLIGTTVGDHYDWRFFNGVQFGTVDQSLTLHRLIRTWLSFTRKSGITTWIAHGSLLSWYWNGMAFPWDNDIDVQVPIMDLHKLSLQFNQTIVVEDPEDGFGRNGNNNIDARFIDIDTGLYIDITALALSNSETPKSDLAELPKNFEIKDNNYKPANELLQIYNCRNNHFNSYDELSPLMKSSVEGEIGYIPSRYSTILTREYRSGLSSNSHGGYIFIAKLRLWVKEEDLYYFIKHHPSNTLLQDYSYLMSEQEYENLQYSTDLEHDNPFKKTKKPLELKNSELEKLKHMNESELLQFLNNDDILIQFFNAKEFTSFHESEIMQLTFGKSTAKLMSSAIDFPPIKYEPYLYKLNHDLDTFENKVDRYLALQDAYQQEHNNSPSGSSDNGFMEIEEDLDFAF
ncbi:LicD family protein [Candida albicans]|uniref:LicD family protein n=1 Tax=Candida albicans TaxID=5476 RepID=A0A8H6C233_CANAX|nr:LicD family protein [Candida albicans]